MLTRNDALRILGFEEKSAPSAAELKAAWKKAAKKFHPDVSDLPDADLKFKLATEAYELLTKEEDNFQSYWEEFKEESRREAERRRSRREKKPCPPDRVIKPEKAHLGSILIPLECFLIGDTAFIQVSIAAPCEQCLEDKSQWIECKICDTTGFVPQFNQIFSVNDRKCSQCSGEGWIRKHRCRVCRGSLKTTKSKTLEINIPRSASFTPRNIHLEGQGNEGWNCEPGDVFLQGHPDIERLKFLTDEEKITLRDLLSRK